MAALGQVSDFYGNDFADLPKRQSFESLGYGSQAAALADPFANERKTYQNQLRALMENPGDFASSPAYQFAYNQGLEALQRKAAAQGRLNSGNYLADLMDYGKKSVSQLYFPQANLLSMLSGASTGSPAAAGLAFARGTERSQDYAQMASANQRYQNQGAPMQSGAPMPTNNLIGGQSYSGGNYGLPSGGYDTGYSAIPSYGSGTGYITSDYGTTNFGLPSGQSYDPYAGLDLGGYNGSYYQDYGGNSGAGSSFGDYNSLDPYGDYWTGNLDYTGDYGG